MKTALSFALMLCGIVFATSASAVTMFTDRTTWQTAAGGGAGDIFEDFNGEAPNPLPFDAGPFTVSETGDGDASITTAVLHPAVAVNGTDYLFTSLDSFGPNNTVTFNFDTPIGALGFDLNPFFGEISFLFSDEQ